MNWSMAALIWLIIATSLLGLSLGAIAIICIHTLTGGEWGKVLAPPLHRLALALPAGLLLMVPLFAAIPLLMPYLSLPADRLPASIAAKIGYLQPFWVILRTIAAAICWLLALMLRQRSRGGASAALILWAVGVTIFTTDWMQALDPGAISTIYPVLVMGATLSGALALAILASSSTANGDLGKLLLGAIMFWAYLAAMQWVIVWMGNLPAEVEWYTRRDGWWSVVLVLTVFLFAVIPFLCLLLRRFRRDVGSLKLVATCVLAGYFAEAIWRLGPGPIHA